MVLATIPLAVWMGLIATPVLIAIGQVLFKVSSNSLGRFDLSNVLGLALNPVFMLAVALYGATTILWVFVLRSVPLSLAYSFMGITYLVVPILSAAFLGEMVSWRILLGAAMIFGGVLVANS